MKQFSIFLLLLSWLPALEAQPNVQPPAELAAAMKKLQFLEGQWKGTAWMQMGPQKKEALQTETVQWHANGTVLTIDGLGVDAADPKVKVHQAYATISYDLAGQRYRMQAFKGDGQLVEADFKVLDDGSIQWGFQHPKAGHIRYHIRLEDGKWVETGESSRDGQTWTPFFSTKLTRQ
jgi:hypothetical protein